MMQTSHLDECYFNWRKCMWETFPEHWSHTRVFVVVAFVWPTELTRGVARRFRDVRVQQVSVQ